MATDTVHLLIAETTHESTSRHVPVNEYHSEKKRQQDRGLQTGLTCVSAKRDTKQKAVGYEA